MAQSFKKNQESLYYIRPTDFRFALETDERTCAYISILSILRC